MLRTVHAHLELTSDAGAELIFSVAAARNTGYDSVDETLSITADGEPVKAREVVDAHGTVLHLLEPTSDVHLVVDYNAEVSGHADLPASDVLEEIHYRRPSRYVQSDELLATAGAQFRGIEGQELLDAITSWVGGHLAYVPGWSRPTDGAVHTLLSREGVCRDFAHLTIALLRARDVPARLVSAFAPGLSPMDFHAVVEAWVEGEWRVVDATGLAPRSSLLRIATGRDAADTAFLTTYSGIVELKSMVVGAVVDGSLPHDDWRSPLQMG